MAATERRLGLLILLCATVLPAVAAVLPEERADTLYHSYDGGGVKITGPSVLVRKQLGGSASISANYYVDAISGASIDVIVSGASPYKEERIERSASIDLLQGKTLMGLAYTESEENDFLARTAHFNLSQSFFGDLTTLSLGYSQGEDSIGKFNQPDFSEEAKRRSFRIGLSQVLSKNLLVDLGWEATADEGFLNNPYRSVRYLDPVSPKGYSLESERYPRTHTTHALAIRSRYYLPYRASLHAEYRYFQDSWGIVGQTAEFGYTHPLESWIFDLRYRYYRQEGADFYSDLFPYADAQNFLARDKELSTFHDSTLGVGASYELLRNLRWLDKGTLNLRYDFVRFDYDDFRDLTENGPVGEEPLYGFSAHVTQFYLSIWY